MVALQLAQVAHRDTGFLSHLAQGQVFDQTQLAQLLSNGLARVQVLGGWGQVFRAGQAGGLQRHSEAFHAQALRVVKARQRSSGRHFDASDFNFVARSQQGRIRARKGTEFHITHAQ